MKVSELVEWPVIWPDAKRKAWRLTQYVGLATSRGYQLEVRGDGSSFLTPGGLKLLSAVHVGDGVATRYDEPWEAQVEYEGRAACIYAPWSTLAWLGFIAGWPRP